MIQIGCKLETRANLDRLGMFYGNKTTGKFSQFQVGVACPGQLAQQLQCQAKPIDSEIEAQAQVQQLVNFVCLTDFADCPLATVSFDYT